MITPKESPNTPEELIQILNPLVKQWFFSRFKEFSLPQLFGVMEIHSRKNILISAPTGATKTLTGFLSILNELVDNAEKGILEDRVYCIYCSPLKALNEDIKVNLVQPLQEMERIAGKALGIRVGVRTGDTTTYEKTQMLKTPPHILITTPESLAIVLSSKKFKDHLTGVAWVIIDEIHALAENKRGVHLSLSIERLEHLARQITRIGLSATIAPLEEVAHFLVGSSRDCVIIDVQFLKQMDLKVLSPVADLINVTHSSMHQKMYELLDRLIQEHKTTLVFTNTRSATERVVHHLKETFPKNYTENIGAHHGSLSAEHRHAIERNLRDGKLKCVVCSTSLELGIDIGYVDLVICLGSPKSVARALQRIGRSGHQLHATTKGRIIVLDRDDLVECSVLLKSALEKKIDTIHVPQNALDVLAQQIFGMTMEQEWREDELYQLIKQSYCYATVPLSDFQQVLSFLAGEYTSLEDRHVYAKIWRHDGMIGRKGKLARVIYMTNVGTIPDQTGVKVKVGDKIVGIIEEDFLERLRQSDIFVLGGSTYKFKYAQGMVANVEASVQTPPTIPSWFSEMLPLSFDLAMDIGRLRRLLEEKFVMNHTQQEIIDFILHYLYVDDNSAQALYEYFKEQYEYCSHIPHDKKLLIEYYDDEVYGKSVVFHSLYGRRVNDVLSRSLAFILAKMYTKDIVIGINDNGFYLRYDQKMNIRKAFDLVKADKLDILMQHALDKTEVLRRRFRHCAGRALMILRTYKGHTKRVGRQQMNSMLLLNAVKKLGEQFCILKEARREVLEDVMDIGHAKQVLRALERGEITLKEITTRIPSPFAFNLVLQGHFDIMKIEDKHEFLRRMHSLVHAHISLEKGKRQQHF